MPEPSGDEPSGARLSARRKQAEFQRANGCCEYCRSQVRYSPNPFSVEHIMPRAGGGTDRPDNLALSCQGCNNCKYTSVDAIDPVTGATVRCSTRAGSVGTNTSLGMATSRSSSVERRRDAPRSRSYNSTAVAWSACATSCASSANILPPSRRSRTLLRKRTVSRSGRRSRKEFPPAVPNFPNGPTVEERGETKCFYRARWRW